MARSPSIRSLEGTRGLRQDLADRRSGDQSPPGLLAALEQPGGKPALSILRYAPLQLAHAGDQRPAA
jgi:hypothetical protein